MSIDDSDAALRIVEAGRRRVTERLRDAFAHQVSATADLGTVDASSLDGLIAQAADRAGASLWRISLAEGAAGEFGITVPEALNHSAVAAAEQLVGPPEQPEPVPNWTMLPVEGDDDPELPEPAAVDTAPFADDDDDAYDAGEDQDADEHQDGGDDTGASVRDRLARWDQVASEAPDPAGAPTEPTEPSTGSDQDVILDSAAVDEGAEPVSTPSAPSASATGGGGAPQALRIAAVHTGGIETLKAGDKDLELRLSNAGLDVIRRSSGVAIGRLDWSEVTAIDVEEPKKRLRGRKARALNVHTERGQAGFELPGLTDEESAEHLEPMLERLRASGQLGTAVN